MKPLLLKATAALTETGTAKNVCLRVQGRVIEKLADGDRLSPQDSDPHAKIIDLDGLTLVPGLVDVHVQGCLGADVWENREEAPDEMSRNLVRFGTTRFLITTTYNPQDVKRLGAHCRKGLSGAQALGLHLEGPFLSPERLGAIPKHTLRHASLDQAKEILDQCEGTLKMMTLAPEVPGVLDIVEFLVERGVTVSLGHSAATYEEALASFERGVNHATHLFNAMSSIHHREPNAVTAALLHPDVTVQLIPDGIHLHPAVIDMVFRLKGPKRVAIITDAVRAAGLPDGEYPSGEHGEKIRLRQGSVRLQDGTLAGSALTMDLAVQLAMEYGKLTLSQAIQSAVQTPLSSVGVKRPAFLREGMVADVVGLDNEGRARFSMVEGKICHSA